MIRIVAFLLALLLAPLTARGNTFDTYVLELRADRLLVALRTNANDQGRAAINGSCTGTCNYGTAGVGPYVGGFVPGSRRAYIRRHTGVHRSGRAGSSASGSKPPGTAHAGPVRRL